MEYQEKKTSLTYKIIKGALKLFYPEIRIVGRENLPDGPVIIAGNHCQMHGPITAELFFPGNRFTWCAGDMMELKAVPAYAFKDFWSQKPRWTHPFYRLLSYLIAPLAACVFTNANTVAVHRDVRIMSTFKDTMAKLNDGAQIIIFPEHDVKKNNIIYDFQDKFIDVARMYFKRSKAEIPFVPMYIAPKLKMAVLGKPIYFDASAPINEERARICSYLMEEITEMGRALPEHTVIPYRNIPKKLYPSNKEF